MNPILAASTDVPVVTAGSRKSAYSELSSEEFMKILFTEMSNQDPFEPNDSAAMLEQLNSIRSIEADTTMIEQLKDVVSQNQFASAGALIGKNVQGLTEDANRVAGRVVSVARQGDSTALLLDTGWVVPMSNLEAVVDPNGF
jgi:flagellar basal-body rod modification protein FlgD